MGSAGGVGGGGSGDDRLSRSAHYHGPGGLNGRVRDGNGWGPASIVAGSRPGGGQARRPRWCRDPVRGVGHIARRAGVGVAVARSHRSRTRPPNGSRGRPIEDDDGAWGRIARTGRRPPAGWAAADRGGQAARLLGPVGCGGRPPCTPGLSTWSSSRSLHDQNGSWKPRLEEGFALRCLQRLSFPDLATRRCPERDSRHTRGRSSPILSY